MTAEQKIVQYLNEAHALESALVQTLTAHLAITPASEYRDLLERHLGETQEHAARILARLGDLGEGRNPLEIVYGIAQTAVGQVVAASKLPLDLLRGTAGEEKLLKNAKDEATTEALEIATYDALEAVAEAAGDGETAKLAREHRVQEEAFLGELRGLIPQLSRDVLQAEGVEVASAAGGRERAVVSPEKPAAPKRPAPAPEPAAADLPIEGYDTLPVQQIVPKLRLLTMPELRRVEEHERAGQGRKQVLDRIAKLRSSTNGATAPARR